MKHGRVLRIMAVATIFALLAVFVPFSSVWGAVGTINISSSSGPVDSIVAINGSGFTAGRNYFVRFNTNNTVAQGLTGTGAFSTSFNVPPLARSSSPYTIDVITHADANPADTSNILYFAITPKVTLGAASGKVGDSVLISGNGFYASSTITIYLDSVVVGTTSASSSGVFTGATFTVPPASNGSHTIKAKDTSEYSPGVTLTVSQKITVSPIVAGGVGDKITVSGTGFAANSNVAFYWDNDILTAENAPTNASGSFTISTFNIPPTSRGSHTIKAQDTSGNAATATFTVAQKIAISPASGAAGTAVTVTGNGFTASKTIIINYHTAPVITTPSPITVSANGSFSATFNVPAALSDTYTVEATDGTYKATANYLAIAEAKISQMTTAASPGHVGMEVIVSGSGFKPNTTVTIYYATEPVVLATTTTDASGVFSATVKIPPSIGGDHTITATDGTTIKSLPFYMEKQAPPIPQPLLPLNAGKAKALAQFDWEDVSDLSGFTYTLQIAKDKSFSSIVLEKKALTKSEYNLIEAEKLPSNKKSTPYYWRIKAVDGAFNESGWTTPGTFNVGFALEFTGWVLYAVIGVGGLLLFLIGFFLGRRSMIA